MDWLDPLNRLILRQAFEHRAASVTLRDGRVFDLTYAKFKPAVTEEFETVTVRVRGDSLVPRGTFKLAEVLKLEWLAVEKDGRKK
jgi:hypothetical protein